MMRLQLVTVFASGDPTRLAVAKLVLRAEGIPFITMARASRIFSDCGASSGV